MNKYIVSLYEGGKTVFESRSSAANDVEGVVKCFHVIPLDMAKQASRINISREEGGQKYKLFFMTNGQK